MRKNASFWLRGVMIAVLILALGVLPARADDEEDDKPFQEPDIQYIKYEKPYLPWVAGTLIILGVLFIAFKNPHRSHMD